MLLALLLLIPLWVVAVAVAFQLLALLVDLSAVVGACVFLVFGVFVIVVVVRVAAVPFLLLRLLTLLLWLKLLLLLVFGVCRLV